MSGVYGAYRFSQPVQALRVVDEAHRQAHGNRQVQGELEYLRRGGGGAWMCGNVDQRRADTMRASISAPRVRIQP